MRIDGKVALITGASAGIGAACAAEFARSGAQLSLCARSEEGLRRAGGDRALITAGDITDESVRRRVVERTLERFGAIDILIDNAGSGLYIPSWEAPEAEVRRLMELNFFALLGMIQLVTPHMRARRSGTIVNVGSIGGKIVLPWMTVYSASKYAVGALTEGLRMELRRDGIRTMLVCPGYVITEFQRRSVGEVPPQVVKGRRFAITAAECAADIRRGVERDARTVMSPRVGWLLVGLARLLPRAVEARMARMNGTA
ncbi:MAG: SDR family NAD(P)-dependent oxidoreductase [Bryobacteraceae bacterium]